MKTIACLLLAAWAALVPGARAADGSGPDRGNFVYTQAGHHVTVWYYFPANSTPQTPIVIVMHGVKRNGEDYLNDWTGLAQKNHFLLVVPEFSEAEFPHDDGYIYGNTVDRAGRPVPRDQWAFSMIEPVFDAVRARAHNVSERYSLYGHSAGAQFVQRFIYFVPQARIEHAVGANAGWYMLPDLAGAFPYGLKGTPVTAADLRHALGLSYTVLLGTADIDPHDKVLRHTPESDAQGMFRFARGHYFFAHAELAARALGTDFGWRLATAPGIAHSDSGMAPFAIQWLLSGKTSSSLLP